ncbi:MAG: N-acetylmuramoyl-L-alanine amidase [Hyphomicrobiaceae bacterium]
MNSAGGDVPVSLPFVADTKLACAVVPAVNIEPRRDGVLPRYLILHYTGMSSAEKAVQWLACAQSRVSCHYVIGEDGAITQLVPEGLRAWHAGVSLWAGECDVNSASIGIEIQNPGHEDGYPDFPASQMAAVAALSRDIVERHGIRPRDVLAHSDVAPARKIDPGEKFDWGVLHAQGVGHWVEPAPVDTDDPGFERGYFGPAVDEAQTALRRYGYGVEVSGTMDAATSFALRAFQLHFRPGRIDGRLDRSTLATLHRLIEALPVC